jgi:hypothetical protein
MELTGRETGREVLDRLVAAIRAGQSSLWAQAFREILEFDDIDEDTDFFQAGGYSRLIPRLLSCCQWWSGIACTTPKELRTHDWAVGEAAQSRARGTRLNRRSCPRRNSPQRSGTGRGMSGGP